MNSRTNLMLLIVLLLALVACAPGGTESTEGTEAAPANTPTVSTEPTATTATESTAITDTETTTETETVTESGTMTATESMTGTEAMTDTEAMTETESMTGTAEMTTTGDTANAADAYQVELNPADFVEVVDNPYYPLIPGSKYVYERQAEDGVERTEVEVLTETKEILGIPATVVRDTVFVGDEMIEDTYDWFAQDKEGNVWYLGEDVTNYENGQVKDQAGSWEAGVDGAMPGIVMFGDPAAHVGETYQQEYYAGEAEDMGELLSVSETVTIPYGTFDNVVLTRDFTPLEPGVEEQKYYAQGIGVVKVVDMASGAEEVLVEFTAP